MANVVNVNLFLLKEAFILQKGHNGFAGLKPVHPFKGVNRYPSPIVHNLNRLQVVSGSHFKVVKVVGRRYLHGSCSELRVNVFVGYYWNLPSYYREPNLFAYYVFVAFVVWINGNCNVSKESFGPCSCNHYVTVPFNQGIPYVPEVAVNLFVFNFKVGKCRVAPRTPVDEPFPSVYQPFPVQLHKGLPYSL